MKVKKSNTLPLEQRKKLQKMMDRDGREDTRIALGISRHAMERACAGLNIQAGTLALLNQKLADVS